MSSIRAAAFTDIGRIRRENEDRYVCDNHVMLFGVADGVGGLPGGAEAAETAINEIIAGVRALPANEDPSLGQIVQRANGVVAKLGSSLSPTMGIGSTLTIGCIRDGEMRIAHVGDSRCYLAQAQRFLCLTQDHSVENEAKMRRARGEVVYYHEANRHALTRCIGQPGRVEVDLVTRPLSTGDRYLFCTDGVTRMIQEHEMAALVRKHGQPADGVTEIVKLAVSRGGPDNATAVLVYIDSK